MTTDLLTHPDHDIRAAAVDAAALDDLRHLALVHGLVCITTAYDENSDGQGGMYFTVECGAHDDTALNIEDAARNVRDWHCQDHRDTCAICSMPCHF